MQPLVVVIALAFDVYWWLILAEVIFSWIPRSPVQPRWLGEVRAVVHRLTEPYLGLFRRFIPVLGAGGMGIDLSPLVGLMVLWLLRRLVLSAVFRFSPLVLP